MKKFDYLIEKIMDQDFDTTPFKFIYIEDFFNKEDFERIVNAKQVSTPSFQSTEEMCEKLQKEFSYAPISFPGCTPNIKSYLEWFNSNSNVYKVANKDLLEGVGIAFRLQTYEDTILEELVNFFNSDKWHTCIKEKFNKSRNTRVETAIQKYLSGYEISPHPDIRKKCATYMININHPNAENLELHTHFMKFKPDMQSIYKYWTENLEKDRCWVPWDWADTCFKHSKNNSITMFAPDNDTLHAVKLNYNHLDFQRTQFYGNLWYTDEPNYPKTTWKHLEGIIN
jgi:hypothetical protein